VTALDRIAELAKKATPGPWHSPGIGEVHAPDHRVIVEAQFACNDPDSLCGTQADAEYIAALSPEVVLAMVEVIRAAKEMRVAWKKTETFLGPNKEEKSFDAAISKLEQMK
jgi:hypothetical protein